MENISMNSLLKSLREEYQKGDYEKVKDLLLKNREGLNKGEFHYNLGTVYSKSGNYAVGRYHLEKALHEGYESVAVKHNLKSVKRSLEVQDITSSKAIDDVLISKGLEYGFDFYLFASLLIAVIGIGLFSKKVIQKWSLVVLLFISLVPISSHYLYFKKLNVGVSFKDVEIFEGPSGIFEKIGKVPSGAKVIIGKVSEGWFFIERPLDYVGWVKSDDLGVLK